MTPPKTLLFVLNLTRLLFIFIWLVLDGPAFISINSSDTSIVALTNLAVGVTIIIIIILVLTSVNIEYPQTVNAILGYGNAVGGHGNGYDNAVGGYHF